jgi:hypothetical protein
MGKCRHECHEDNKLIASFSDAGATLEDDASKVSVSPASSWNGNFSTYLKSSADSQELTRDGANEAGEEDDSHRPAQVFFFKLQPNSNYSAAKGRKSEEDWDLVDASDAQEVKKSDSSAKRKPKSADIGLDNVLEGMKKWSPFRGGADKK